MPASCRANLAKCEMELKSANRNHHVGQHALVSHLKKLAFKRSPTEQECCSKKTKNAVIESYRPFVLVAVVEKNEKGLDAAPSSNAQNSADHGLHCSEFSPPWVSVVVNRIGLGQITGSVVDRVPGTPGEKNRGCIAPTHCWC